MAWCICYIRPDLRQGYQSKDKTFAVEILGKALNESASSEKTITIDGDPSFAIISRGPRMCIVGDDFEEVVAKARDGLKLAAAIRRGDQP